MKARIDMLRNVAWVALANYVESAIGLAVGVLIARTLGPADYGHYAFAVWVCGMLLVGVNHALPTTAIKFIAESRGSGDVVQADALAHRFLRLQTLSSAVVIGGFMGVMLIWPLDDWGAHLAIMLAAIAVAVWSRAGFWMWSGLNKGYEQFVPPNRTLVLMALVNGLCALILAWRSASVAQFFCLYAGIGVALLVALRLASRRVGIVPARAVIPEATTARVSRHVLLTGGTILLGLGTNRMVEMTLLKSLTTSVEVAYFAIAGSLTKGAVDLLTGGLSAVLLPAMARRFGEGGSSGLGHVVRESTRLYSMAGLAVVGLGLTVHEGLVHLLYGHRYDGALPVLMWSLVIAGLTVTGGAAVAALAASDHQRDRLRILALSLATNVAVGLWLVPRYGLMGAIGSMAITQGLEFLLNWRAARRRIRTELPLGVIARQAAAALVAAALAYPAATLPPVAGAFLGGAVLFILVYLGLCMRWGTLRCDEIDVLAHLVARAGGPLKPVARGIGRMRRFGMDADGP